jgi:hypothetical protein
MGIEHLTPPLLDHRNESEADSRRIVRSCMSGSVKF